MKSLILLLFVSTANLVICGERGEVDFLAEHLKPDLEAIEKYFNKINKDIYAFVHWPEDITFVISYDSNNHLKIQGKFSDGSKKKFTLYEGLYYKQGNFYVTNTKKNSLDRLSKDTPLCYFQSVPKKIPQTDHYVSIRYFSLLEIKKMIEKSSLTGFWPYLVDDLTTTSYYLATTPKFDHLIEYNICRYYIKPAGAEGGLRALITKEHYPRKLIKNVEAKMLKMRTPAPTLTVTDGEWSIENVFGVRMATIGFLTEVKGSRIKMFNSGDLSDMSPEHVIPVSEFVSKIKKVEPVHLNPDKRVCNDYKDQPDNAYFQILGHILEKKVKYDHQQKDKNCPLIIEHASKNGYFLYGEERVEKLCATDGMVWAITDDGRKISSNEEDITLVYNE